MKKRSRDKVVTLGWSGRWRNGDIGWFISEHASGYHESPSRNPNAIGEKCYRVRITVQALKDRRGRYIARKFPGDR